MKTSSGRYTYTPGKLLDHFVNIVLPLADVNEVLVEAPIELPGLPELYQLGTRAQDSIELDKSLNKNSVQFRLRTMHKREKLEHCGYGDELMELQQHLWPEESVSAGKFKLDKLFEYKDGDKVVLKWCQGKVIECINEKQGTHFVVKVKWNSKCLRDGHPEVTTEKLMRTNWNLDVQSYAAWREDLYEKVLKIN